MKQHIFFSIIFTLFVFGIFYTGAQSQSINFSDLFDPNTGLPVGVDEQISIEQIPKIPKPGEIVFVRITSYLTDLNKAKITWTQDGTVLTSANGATTNQFQAPSSGQTSRVVITIEKESGGVITKTITLSPADVDLIYEAQTYAHPFFKGKRLFTSESVLNFIALPNFVTPSGNKIPEENLVYTWSINGTVQKAISGYGQNTFITQGGLIERPITVKVDVSAPNSTLTASQSVTLRSTVPEVLIYENNPLLGVVYENAILGNFLLKRFQVDFEAIPYFFDVVTKNDPSIEYTWFINRTRITSKAPQENYLLLQNTENTDGSAIISATVSHTQNILQNAQNSIDLTFEKVIEQNNEAINF